MARRPHPGDPRHHREDIHKLQARVAGLERENDRLHYTLTMAGVELGDYGEPEPEPTPALQRRRPTYAELREAWRPEW